jgi:hypothetical protein
MTRVILGFAICCAVFTLTASRAMAQENSGRDFTRSVIYGTLAGTLVGVATLAFTSNPGDNLNNVARGASYGLYAGIILGLYITYGFDDSPEPEAPQQDLIPQEPNIYEGNPPMIDEDGNPVLPDQSGLRLQGPSVAVFPILPTMQSPDDWGAGINLIGLRF